MSADQKNSKSKAICPPLPTHELAVLIQEEEIQRRIQEMAHQIADDYRGRDPVLVCVLKGAFMFVADLIRSMDIPLTTEFIRVSSYGDQVVTSGEVKIELDLATSVSNRNVILVEDIVETGLTLEYLKTYMRARSPRSLTVCALLHKPGNNVKVSNLDYIGFNIGNDFVVGYGLDYRGYYRNLPHVATFRLTEGE